MMTFMLSVLFIFLCFSKRVHIGTKTNECGQIRNDLDFFRPFDWEKEFRYFFFEKYFVGFNQIISDSTSVLYQK